MWSFLQEVFSYMENIIIKYNDNTIFKLMLNIFPLFMFQYQYKHDGVTSVWIQCTNCKKHVPCQISETVTKEIISVLTKSCVMYHVSLSWMIKLRRKLSLILTKSFLIGVYEGHGIMQNGVTS